MMTISKRLQIPANAISALLLMALGVLLLRSNIATQEKMIADKAAAMGTFLDKSSVNYLINFDLSALDLFAKQVVKDGDFVFAVFVDEKGKPLTELPKNGATNAAVRLVEQPITGPDGARLGTIRLGYTLQRVHRQLPRDIALCAGVVLLAQVVMTVGLGLVTRSIRRSLGSLADQLAQNAVATSHASRQIAHSSQSLAEGSSEQAASIEETSASLEEMSSMIRRNAENAQKANDLAKQARQAADKGAGDMQAMGSAMEAMKASSDDIAKIIKTIDEIAFQTNILALNAAVEAARAGEAGMGFAVVADEVRNLAQRSAQAAKETAAKIEGAISNAAQGVDLSGKVGVALNGILTKARQVDELITEVASASREQSQGIAQINTAVSQMDKVTQSNAASAEESAAASEELNAQAEVMKGSVKELLNLVGGSSAGGFEHGQAAVSPRAGAASIRAKGASTGGSGQPKAAAWKNAKRAEKPAPAGAKAGRSEIPLEGEFKEL